jgi:hypothetical protein
MMAIPQIMQNQKNTLAPICNQKLTKPAGPVVQNIIQCKNCKRILSFKTIEGVNLIIVLCIVCRFKNKVQQNNLINSGVLVRSAFGNTMVRMQKYQAPSFIKNNEKLAKLIEEKN